MSDAAWEHNVICTVSLHLKLTCRFVSTSQEKVDAELDRAIEKANSGATIHRDGDEIAVWLRRRLIQREALSDEFRFQHDKLGLHLQSEYYGNLYFLSHRRAIVVSVLDHIVS